MAGQSPHTTHTLFFCSMRPCPTSILRTSCSFTTSQPGSQLTSSGNRQTGTSKSSAPLACCTQLGISAYLEHWDLVSTSLCWFWGDKFRTMALQQKWMLLEQTLVMVCVVMLAMFVFLQVEHDTSDSQCVLFSHQE